MHPPAYTMLPTPEYNAYILELEKKRCEQALLWFEMGACFIQGLMGIAIAIISLR